MGGEIRFDDRDIAGEQPEDIISYGLSFVPQSNNVFEPLTVPENQLRGTR